MTIKQKQKIQNIRDSVVSTIYGKQSENYEIKQFKITESEYDIVSIIIELGMKNDEGTLAECLCRNTAIIFVGKNGALKHIESKTSIIACFYFSQYKCTVF